MQKQKSHAKKCILPAPKFRNLSLYLYIDSLNNGVVRKRLLDLHARQKNLMNEPREEISFWTKFQILFCLNLIPFSMFWLRLLMTTEKSNLRQSCFLARRQ